MQITIETIISMVLLGAIGSVLVVAVVPLLQVMLRYGKTWNQSSLSSGIVDWISQHLTVPKKWFLHFYLYYFGLCVVVLTCPNFFWGTLATFGFHLVTHYPLNGNSATSSISPILSHMIFFQSARRLVESVCITKFSPTARINITHYIAGIIFYLAITMTVGLTMQLKSLEWNDFTLYTNLSLLQHAVLAVFVIANVDQFCNHLHLKALIKYTEPSKGLFHWVAAAHYFDEVMIYMTIALLGYTGNHEILQQNKRNLLLCLLFVVVNLSASARQSLNYYQARSSKKKYAIFPLIY